MTMVDNNQRLISATILILSFTTAPYVQFHLTHMSILPTETLCLTVMAARGMGHNKLAAVGSKLS